jgi:hypothetical protein
VYQLAAQEHLVKAILAAMALLLGMEIFKLVVVVAPVQVVQLVATALAAKAVVDYNLALQGQLFFMQAAAAAAQEVQQHLEELVVVDQVSTPLVVPLLMV